MSSPSKAPIVYVRMDASDHEALKERVSRDQTSIQAFCSSAIKRQLTGSDEGLALALTAMETRIREELRAVVIEEITTALNAIRRESAIELANVQAAAFGRLEERIDKQEQAFLLLMNRLLGVKS